MSYSINDNICKIKKQVVNNPELNYNAYCKVVKQGEFFADATYMSNKTCVHIRKLNKKEYVILKTGEIKEYKEKATNDRQQENLQRTFNNIRWLIRHNFESDADNQLFITLTYRKPMKERNILMTDFENFFKRLKRAFPEHKFDYLIICEPTAKGTWHIHLMLKSDKPVLILPNKQVAELWRQGFTVTKRLKGDDIGTYYTAYFTDIIPEELDNEETDAKTKSKAREKGARLKFYPPNFKFYRRSKGIKDPVHTQSTLEQLAKEYGEPTFKRKYIIEKESEEENGETSTKTLNEITKVYYKKQNKKQLE